MPGSSPRRSSRPATTPACGLLKAGTEALTVEFKANFLAPARGEGFVCRGRVLRPGRTLTVCEGQAVAVADGLETPIAVMTATMMAVSGQAR